MPKTPDITSFNNLFNNHYQQFVAFANGYVRDMGQAEDFVSDAFETYWNTRSTLTNNANIPGYILTIIKNKCLNYLQHKKVKIRVEQEISENALWLVSTQISSLEACDPNQLISNEMVQIIESTIDQLPNKTAQIFKLSRFEELPYLEIAQKLELSTKAIEYHISKALSELRKNLKEFIMLALISFII